MHHPTDRITHTTAFVTPVMEHWLEREIAQWVHPMKDQSNDPSHHERTLLPQSYKGSYRRKIVQVFILNAKKLDYYREMASGHAYFDQLKLHIYCFYYINELIKYCKLASLISYVGRIDIVVKRSLFVRSIAKGTDHCVSISPIRIMYVT